MRLYMFIVEQIGASSNIHIFIHLYDVIMDYDNMPGQSKRKPTKLYDAL